MTDQTPNGEKKPAAPAPAKKKVSAYDQPFSIMKEADQIETPTARPEPASRPAPQPIQSDWRSTSTATPERSEPAKEPTPKKTSTTSGQQKKKTSNIKTQKAKNEIPKAKSSAPSPKDKEPKNQINMDIPRSAKIGHKILPYVYFGLALFVGISLLLNIFCNWQNSLDDPTQHWMGTVGYHICYGLFGLFGPAVFTLPALLVVLGIYWKRYIDNKIAISKIIASVLFITSLAAVIHIFCLIPFIAEYGTFKIPADDLMHYGAEMTGGGLIGGSVGYLLYSLGNFVGSLIIGFFLLAVSLFYLLGMTPQHLWNRMRNHHRTHGKHAPS